MQSYEAKVADIVDKGMVSLALAFGNSAGIFDAFEYQNNKSTASELARLTGLKER